MAMKNITAFALITIMLAGCVGNKAEVSALKIERKQPAPVADPRVWAETFDTLLGRDDGSD